MTSTGMLSEKSRISVIDLMRGIVMVIMALDHTRDFFHINALVFDPTDMTKTNPLLFFTRWITHFCAPTFVFLSGVAIRISSQRKIKKELAVFLLTRGLWLILLEVVVVRFSFFFSFYYDFTFFQVIWAIGASMVILSALIFLPEAIVFILGLVITIGHNLTDIPSLKPDAASPLWILLNQSGFIPIDANHGIFVPYPVFPWLGIMLLGFGVGRWYLSSFDLEKRRKLLLTTGIGVVVLFIILRYLQVYGDPAPWSVQKNAMFTVMSFLNTTKYPVSLMYSLMTLGPVLIILAMMERVRLNFLQPLVVFGRVPLFYYILHFFLIHAVSLVAYMISSEKSFSEIDLHFSAGFGGIPPGVGVELPWVYPIWIAIVLLLYPVCRWYNQYKSTHKHWWLSYL